MDKVSFMTDYLPVHMLAMAQEEERRFADCLMSCPRSNDGVIRIDEAEVFTRLIEFRIKAILLSLASLESYLGYLAARTARSIEEREPGITLRGCLDAHHLHDVLKTLPNRAKRRHELILEENGDRPVTNFLTSAPLALDEKLMYWTLIRCGKMINFKDGYIKKAMRIISLRGEILHPDLRDAEDSGKISRAEQVAEVFLHHRLPDRLTPGKSCADRYIIEWYGEHHFFWELLHVYPDRMVQEVIQYLHMLDESENHFIVALRAAELLDWSGEPVTEPVKQYVIEVNLDD